MKKIWILGCGAAFCLLAGLGAISLAQSADTALDAKVRAFLDKMRYGWHDMNVSDTDGKVLYDIILKNGYTRALEIGTSTGHSGTWIAWALSKTNGKLTTIDIDADRYAQAVSHFKESGLSDRIDARLADAHVLVEQLAGPFDFVFIDADKEWYTNYAKAVIPKVADGGCVAAHNVSGPSRGRFRGGYGGGTAEYYDYMKSLADYDTSIHPQSLGDLAVSYKKTK
jgi:caffeoyl-CoA O-methyltransferase